MKQILPILLSMVVTLGAHAQTITGTFPLLAGVTIRLQGFEGFSSYPIDSVLVDSTGYFTLRFSPNDYGMGYLQASNDEVLFVVLGKEDVGITGHDLATREAITFTGGEENRRYVQFLQEQPRRELALVAWNYLSQLYQTDSLFSRQVLPRQQIQQEQARLIHEESDFLSALPDDSYVKWLLPVRQLVASVQSVAQYNTAEIPATIAAFRQLDYSDNRLYKSGLYKDAIEGHFWLIENGGMSLDAAYSAMKTSIDGMIDQLMPDDRKLNEVTNYLFDLLERHSLFTASEYLAIRVLSETTCTIDTDLAKQLETYRAMKIGNIAPDLQLQGDVLMPHGIKKAAPERLSQINSRYTIVAFAAGWCPKCQRDMPELAANYTVWREHGIEVVLISLDADVDGYRTFASGLPFMAVCDYQQWDSPMAADYHVFSTPTLFLLDESRRILLRPHSVQQLHAYIDWYIIKGNKVR